jgi:hypothetical protein
MINKLSWLIGLIAFGILAYTVSPLIHTLIDCIIAAISPFDTIAEVLAY